MVLFELFRWPRAKNNSLENGTMPAFLVYLASYKTCIEPFQDEIFLFYRRTSCVPRGKQSPPQLHETSLLIFARSKAILTYILTPCCRVLLEKLIGLQIVKKFPSFHGTRRFITALTILRHLSLSWASPIQSTYPHPTSWRSILILSTHLLLGLPSGLFPSSFPTKTLYTPPLLTHKRHMPSPSHSFRFYHPHNIGWGVQIKVHTEHIKQCEHHVEFLNVKTAGTVKHC